MPTLAEIWPLHDLELRTPRLLLRPIRDTDIPGLVAASLAGIHEPEVMPFAVPWTRADPKALALGTAQNVWRHRAELTKDDWSVGFAILHDGEVIGRQDVSATRFADLKTIETGSWLTQRVQGHGFGKEMRAAVLLWAFDHLGAERAETAAMSWNAASAGVSRSLGYQPNGTHKMVIAPGEVQDSSKYLLHRRDLVRPEWELQVSGHEAVAALLGVS